MFLVKKDELSKYLLQPGVSWVPANKMPWGNLVKHKHAIWKWRISSFLLAIRELQQIKTASAKRTVAKKDLLNNSFVIAHALYILRGTCLRCPL